MGDNPNVRSRHGAGPQTPAERNGFPQGSNSSTTHVVNTDGDDQAQRQALQDQLRALKTATNNSRNTYREDIATINNCLSQLNVNSPIAIAFADSIAPLISDNSYDNTYGEAITAIDNTTV